MSAKRLSTWTLGLVAALAALGAWLLAAPSHGQGDTDQGVLARLISRVLSTSTTQVTIGGVEGALSSNAVITDIRISDRDGIWLTLDRAELVWSRLALLRGRLQVDTLRVSRLEVARRPLPPEEPPPAVDGPLLPELPVKVVVGEFSLADLVLGEPVLGTPARIAARGSAELGDPSEGLRLVFQATRQDAPGRFALDLDYVPTTQVLSVGADFDEPAGGLAARALGLQGLPPVMLNLKGQGRLDAFAATLDFTAGDTIGARGQANLASDAAGRRLTLDLAARVEGLLPAPVAPVFSGETKLVGDVVLAESGAIDLRRVNVASATASLDIAGRVGADRALDLTAMARAVPRDDSAPAGTPRIGRLVLEARVGGNVSAPRLNATLDAAAIRLPEGSLDRLDARVAMDPIAGSTSRFTLAFDANGSGIALTDPALARAVGNRVSATARGVLDENGVFNAEAARIELATARAAYRGRIGGEVVDGTLEASLPALAPFSSLAGRTLAGAATFTAKLSGDPSRTAAAEIDARLTDLATGTPVLDGLLGSRVTARGNVRKLWDGFGFNDFRIEGATLAAEINGEATNRAADLGLTLTLRELRRLDPRITGGSAQATARLTGSLQRPDATASIDITNLRALDRSVPRLSIKLEGQDLTGRTDARLALDGIVGGNPATGTVRLLRPAEGGWRLEPLNLRVGSVAIGGALALSQDNLASGDLSVVAGDLDDLSPLLLTRLGGEVNAKVSLSAQAGRQNGRIEGRGSRLAADAIRIGAFVADLTVTDAYGRPVVDGNISADEIVAGGQTFRRVRLESTGDAQASRFTVAASAQGFELEGRGALVPGDPLRVDLASFTARRGGQRIALAQPASISFPQGGVRIADLVVAAGTGRIALSGTAGERLDMTARITALPLSVAEIVQPGLGLSGTLEGDARIQGTTASPTGTYRVTVSRLVAAATRGAGLPPLDIRASGDLKVDRATVDASINAGRAGTLTVTGSAPLGAAGALDLRARGNLDASVANTLLSAGGRRVTGRVALDATVRGSASDPQVEGTARLTGGTFTDQNAGLRFTAIEATLAGRGNAVTIERFSAATPNGGGLTASGRVTLDPRAGFPADIRVTGRRAQLASNPTVTAIANLDLTVTGPVAQRPVVAGRIDIVSLDISLPERLPRTLEPLPETRHVKPGPTARARLARQRQAEAGRSGPPFAAVLDLTITAGNRIFVRGRGLNAELGGDLRLQGTTLAPEPVGAFTLRSGRFDLLGQRIDLVRGEVAFTGDLSPSLDFLAETRAADTTARIGVTGSARQPEITLSSSPDLPQDEILSRILFQRASGGLSGLQALQLASAVAQLSGGGGGGAFENLRKSLGVDSLDITAGAGGPAVGVGRYISDNIRLGVRAGATPAETGVSVDIDVTRRIKVQGQVGADGGTSVGVGVEWEY
jgi:translocation and assembly module TamB